MAEEQVTDGADQAAETPQVEAAESEVDAQGATEASAGDEAVEVQQAELPEAADQPQAAAAAGQIDILLDTAIPVSVRLGEATFAVRELLQLAPGSVLKLDRQVGEPLDLYLRGIPFAKGQLVVVGEQLGVRVTEIFAQGAEAGAEDK